MTYPEVEAFEAFFKSLVNHLHACLFDTFPEFVVLQSYSFSSFIPFSSLLFTNSRDQTIFYELGLIELF